MALTLLSKPKRWSAAHLPLQFAFSYVIDVQAMTGNVQNYLAIGSTENRNGFFGLYPALFAGKFTLGQKFYIGTDTHLIQDKPVTVTEAYASIFHDNSNNTNYSETYYKIDFAYDAQYTILYLYSIDYVRTVDATFQLYISDSYVGNIRYYREFSSGQLIVDISAELAASFGEVQTPIGTGVDNNCFRKYRLDYGIGANVTTGIDFYAVNSVLQPLNPPCSDTLPNWQFDLTTLTCEVVPNPPLFRGSLIGPSQYISNTNLILTSPYQNLSPQLKIGDIVFLRKQDATLYSNTGATVTSIMNDPNGNYLYYILSLASLSGANIVVDVSINSSNATIITGNRNARKKDINPLSATYNQYENSGQYFFYDVNKIACSTTYYSTVQSQQFKKNDCTTGTGSFVNYTVAANTYTSLISQADADSKALAEIAANGQTYANTNGVCGNIHASVETRNQTNNFGQNGAFDLHGDIYVVLKDSNGLPVVVSSLTVTYNITVNTNGTYVNNGNTNITIVNTSEYLVATNIDFQSFDGTNYQTTSYSVIANTGYVTP